MTDTGLTIAFPGYFDAAEAEIRTKGYFADLTIEFRDKSYRPVFYDQVRFAQEARDRLSEPAACYFEPNLILLSKVDRKHIEGAVAWLAKNGFIGLTAELT